MNKAIVTILFILLIPGVHASIFLQQVLYDPIGTESGGEFIQLYNDGPQQSLAKYRIATSSSEKDVTFKDEVIPAFSTLIIADPGWDEKKDDLSWPSADLEETITMKNSNSGIALFENDQIIDAVGWGTDPLYSQGEPAAPAEPGQALVRINNTGDNAKDFIAQAPFSTITKSQNTSQIIFQVIVQDPNFNTTLSFPTDDSSKGGIQIIPFPGKERNLPLIIEPVDVQAIATFEGKEYPLTSNDTFLFTNIPLKHTTPPGTYTIDVKITKNNFTKQETITFEILPLLAFDIDTKSINLGNVTPGTTLTTWGDESDTTLDKPTITNTGNLPLDFALSGTDLVSAAGIINVSHLSVSFQNDFSADTSGSLFYTTETYDINLQVDDSIPLGIQLYVPQEAIPGIYEGSIYFSGVTGE